LSGPSCGGLIAAVGGVHQEVSRLLSLGRGAEDRALVIFQGLKPAFHIGCALVEFRLDAELRAKEARPDLRDQLLEGIGLAVGKLLDPLKALFAACPMGLMPMSA
jgi:hypothetical protein